MTSTTGFDGFGSEDEMASALRELLDGGWTIRTERDSDTGVYTMMISRELVSYQSQAESFIGGFEAVYGQYDAACLPVAV